MANDGFGYCQTPPRGTFITDTLTFIFETGILWSIDTQLLKEPGELPFTHSDLVKAFQNFMALLDRHLGVPLPFRWQVGIEQIQGRRVLMPTPNGQWWPKGRPCAVDRIVKEGLYERGDGPYASLRPFFEEILARCGVDPREYMKGYPSDL